MPKLLTIAIPTYNRAARLDRQLTWLDRGLGGLGDVCDVVLSDNASTDDTPDVCAKWKATIGSNHGCDVRVYRNDCNVGPLPNIARCLRAATSRFTWVIGDDDQIPDGELAWVVERLRGDPDLASIVLNFNSVGRTVYDRCFHFPDDQLGDGGSIMAECLRQAYFGLAFMTAQVYRTEFVQRALDAWPDGSANFDYQVFLTACTGARGRVLATRDTHVTYVTGDNVYERDPRVGLKLYADSLEVFLRLRRAGFDPALCRSLGRHHLWSNKRRLLRAAARNNPLRTLATIARAAVLGTRLAATRLPA